MQVALTMAASVDEGQERASGRRWMADFMHDDASLVDALQSGDPEAPAVFFDRYGAYAERILVRVLGNDSEIEDLLHEVFAEALSSIHQLRDPTRLKPWLTRLAVFRARGAIRYRARRRWLVFRPAEDLPPITEAPAPHEARSLLESVFSILERMRPEERIAFSLRYIEEMKISDAAEACGVSIATFKRHLKKADAAFLRRAKSAPDLYARLEQSPRWGGEV